MHFGWMWAFNTTTIIIIIIIIIIVIIIFIIIIVSLETRSGRCCSLSSYGAVRGEERRLWKLWTAGRYVGG